MSKKSKVSSAKKSTKKPAKAVKKVSASSGTKKTAVKKSKNEGKKKALAKPVKKTVKKVTAGNGKKPVKKTTAPKKQESNKKTAKKSVSASAKKSVKSIAAKKPASAVKQTKTAAKVIKPAKEIKPALAKKNFVLEKPAPKKETEKPIEKPKPVETTAKPESTKVLAITNTIPKNDIPEISPLKIASITSSITNPVKKSDSYSVKVEKEPQGKFELEFVVRSSPEMLFEFLSTPSGLSEWFCDDVNIRNGIFTFIWDGQLQQARLLKTIDDQLVRFQWVDKTDGSYFEFKIQKDDLTNDIALIVTDFAENVSERESSKRLWQSQVEKLMHIIGSIF